MEIVRESEWNGDSELGWNGMEIVRELEWKQSLEWNGDSYYYTSCTICC